MGIIQNLQESLGHVLNNMSRVVFTEAIRTRQYRTCRKRCDLLGNSDWYLIYCVIYLYLTWKSNKARVQSKRMQQKFFKLELLRVFYIKLSKVRVWNLSTNADNSWKCLLYGNRAIVAKSRVARAWNPDKLYHWASRFSVNLPWFLGAGDGQLRVQAAARHR